MKRLNADIGSLDGTLQETPEVFQPIGVNRAINIPLSVIDYLVLVVPIHAVIGAQFIGVKLSAFLDVIFDRPVDLPLTAKRNGLSADLSGFSFEQSKHDSFTKAVPTVYLTRLLIGMHVAGRSTDIGFVGFDRTSHFVDAALMLGVADTMQHEPCSLLRDTQIAGDFVRRNAVLAV